jgi:formate dehydrogenase
MLAMLHVIIRDGLYDKETINNNTRGITELGELAADYPPAKAAKVTGIPKDVIEKLARDFATAENAGIHGSLGINLGTFGTLAYWLIQCLNAITGRLDRRGSMIFCEAPVDVPALYKRLSKNYAHKLSRIGNFPTVMDSLPAGILADEILTPGEGRIKALIVVSGNPMLTVPDPDKLEKAFKSLDLLVCLDLYVNETGGLADYVLACADFYERWDFTWTSMLFNPVRFINYSDAVVRPDGDQRDSWIIMHDVLKASGYTLGKNRTYSFVTNYLDRAGKILRIAAPLSFRPKLIVRALAAASGVSWSRLTRGGHGVLLKDHETGKFFTKRILTDDKRVNLAPPEFVGEAPALKEFFSDEKKYDGFKLIGQRRRRTHNSWFGNVAHLVEKERANLLSMNPGDASELGIKDGDMVEVESDFGSIGIAARVADDLMPGVVSIPHGWGHDKASGLNVAQKHPGTNVNRLMAANAGKLEKFAGMSMLTGVRVKLKKIKKKKREVADE